MPPNVGLNIEVKMAVPSTVEVTPPEEVRPHFCEGLERSFRGGTDEVFRL